MKARKLLIVDDEIEIIKAIEFILSRYGHEILYALSGRAAIEILKTHEVGLIISDYSMADGNGDELLNYVLKHDLPVEFYFFTANNVDRYVRGGLIKGAYSKPADFNLVLSKARSFLKGHPGVAPEA